MYGHIPVWNSGNRDMIEMAIQTGIQLQFVSQATNQNIALAPVHFCQLFLNTSGECSPLKGRFGRIGNQGIQHICDHGGSRGEEGQAADVHLVDALVETVIAIFFLVAVGEEHIGTEHCPLIGRGSVLIDDGIPIAVHGVDVTYLRAGLVRDGIVVVRTF